MTWLQENYPTGLTDDNFVTALASALSTLYRDEVGDLDSVELAILAALLNFHQPTLELSWSSGPDNSRYLLPATLENGAYKIERRLPDCITALLEKHGAQLEQAGRLFTPEQNLFPPAPGEAPTDSYFVCPRPSAARKPT
jgi:hypothetical protein